MLSKSFDEIKNADNDTSFLLDGRYRIEDLVDIENLRHLFEGFSKATGLTTGFVAYPSQKVLISTGWRDICTQFHRPCQASAESCIQSNRHLTECLKELRELNVMPCGNGLVDAATPVVIRGKHLASLTTGQVLLSAPDRERFRLQAQKFGYDEEKYLAALEAVPVMTESGLRQSLAYLVDLAVMIAEQGLANLKLREAAEALRKEREAARETRDILSNILDSVPLAVFWKNRDGVYLGCNQTFAQVHNRTVEQIIGFTDSDFNLPEKDILGYRAADAAIFESGVARRHIIEEVQLPDGKRIWVDTTKIPLKDATGAVNEILIVFEDVTECKRVQDELLAAKRSAEAANLKKIEFLSVMGHEIRTPLNGVLGFCSVLETTDINTEQAGLLEGINRCGYNLLELINSLINFSEMEAGKIGLDYANFDPRDAVSGVCEILAPMARKKGLHLIYEFEDDIPSTMLGDVFRVKQLLSHLLSNAIKFTTAGAVTVHVSHSEGKELRIDVKDTGVGMDSTVLDNLFTPFSMGDASHTRNHGGTGLGLAICDRLINLMGGKIEVQSSLNQGSTFRCHIPMQGAADKNAEIGEF